MIASASILVSILALPKPRPFIISGKGIGSDRPVHHHRCWSAYGSQSEQLKARRLRTSPLGTEASTGCPAHELQHLHAHVVFLERRL